MHTGKDPGISGTVIGRDTAPLLAVSGSQSFIETWTPNTFYSKERRPVLFTVGNPELLRRPRCHLFKVTPDVKILPHSMTLIRGQRGGTETPVVGEDPLRTLSSVPINFTLGLWWSPDPWSSLNPPRLR